MRILIAKNKKELPKNITLTKSGKYQIDIKCRYYGRYNTPEEAKKVRDEKLKELEELEEIERLSLKIKRNDKGECIIELFNENKMKAAEAIVDEELYYDLVKCSWYLSNGYAINTNLGYMHRYVMNYECDLLVDHISGNKLDNRKENLRIVTPKQNSQNRKSNKNSSSKYIGVRKSGKKYEATINVDEKNIYLGVFEIEEDAARAYDKAAKEYKGEFARLNFKIDDMRDVVNDVAYRSVPMSRDINENSEFALLQEIIRPNRYYVIRSKNGRIQNVVANKLNTHNLITRTYNANAIRLYGEFRDETRRSDRELTLNIINGTANNEQKEIMINYIRADDILNNKMELINAINTDTPIRRRRHIRDCYDRSKKITFIGNDIEIRNITQDDLLNIIQDAIDVKFDVLDRI